jgi:DNA modification methylase
MLQSCEEAIDYISDIKHEDDVLYRYFKNKLVTNKDLTRKLVSNQANKTAAHFRWFKYKEAFSSELVLYLLSKYNINAGTLLDPFAGAGTTMLTAATQGLCADGIELLPIGQEIIRTKILIYDVCMDDTGIVDEIKEFVDKKSWNNNGVKIDFDILPITEGAYPPETNEKIKRLLYEISNINSKAKDILFFCLLCILENISYTRKDGQYLRWDYRSGRRAGKISFDKGKILDFDLAFIDKCQEVINDVKSLSSIDERGIDDINLYKGSCLKILPILPENKYVGLITSPPYCNRYDYTRTYALENAMLCIDKNQIINLRQDMLSCTVENKKKDLLNLNKNWKIPIDICERSRLLQAILDYMDYLKTNKLLNNNGIATMIRGYFYEMACVIYECYRILQFNSYMFMVNDNVKYAGIPISVDLILSKIAEDIGFTVEEIMILPRGKGNSSQQMGSHGRDELRKCVYIWKKVCK